MVFQEFRGHIVGRPDQTCSGVVCNQTDVCQNRPSANEQNVGWFDVSVQEMRPMEFVQTGEKFPEDPFGFVRRKRLSCRQTGGKSVRGEEIPLRR